MAMINRIGDGQPVDKDKLNEIIDSINKLYDVLVADQAALIWKGKHDAFDNVAKYRMVSGEGAIRFPGKSNSTGETFTFGGVKFTATPTVFVTARCSRPTTATVIKADGDSAYVLCQITDGKNPPSNKGSVAYYWLAFGPTA